VIAGRIDGSPDFMRAGGHVPAETDAEIEDDSAEQTARDESLQISRSQTAWKIAGIRYNSPTTVYRFPDGRSYSGEQIKDWSDIPPGTRVELGVRASEEEKVVSAARVEVVVPQVNAADTPWKIANALYKSSLTLYILPNGAVQPGNTFEKMGSIPLGTKVLVAYRELPKPEALNSVGDNLQDVYLDSHTLYLFPDRTLRSGDQIETTQLPPSIRVFAKVE
jgi:hypothetical protein